MEKLDMITDAILQLESISIKSPKGYVIYDLEQGNAVSLTLKENHRVHYIDTLLTGETIFPLHEHSDSAETLILESGEVTVVITEPGCEVVRMELTVGIPFYIPSGTNHSLHAKKNSWIFAALIPPDAGILK